MNLVYPKDGDGIVPYPTSYKSNWPIHFPEVWNQVVSPLGQLVIHPKRSQLEIRPFDFGEVKPLCFMRVSRGPLPSIYGGHGIQVRNSL